MTLNLHHLRIFNTVVKEKTTYNAARKLLISQPSVSSQLNKFEKTINCDLFVKEGRTLVLTDIGHQIFQLSEQIFSIENQITEIIDKKNSKITINISGHQLAINQYIKPMIPKLKLSNIPINLNISNKSTEESIQLLESNLIDLAIIGVNDNIPFSLNKNVFKISHLSRDRFCFVVNSKFNLNESLEIESLPLLPFVGRIDDSYSQEVLDDFFESNNLSEVNYEVRFDSAFSALEYTLNNSAIYFCSYKLAQKYLEEGLLQEVPLKINNEYSFTHDLYIVFKKDNPVVTVLRNIVDILESTH